MSISYRQYQYYSKNFYYPLLMINNEYYIINAFPKIWHLPFTFFRTLIFDYGAIKIEEKDLEKFAKKYKNYNFEGLPYLVAGLVACQVGSNSKYEDIIISKDILLFFFVLLALIYILIAIVNYRRGRYYKLDYSNYKLVYSVSLPKGKKMIFAAGILCLTISPYLMIYIALDSLLENVYTVEQIIFYFYGLVMLFISTIPSYFKKGIGKYKIIKKNKSQIKQTVTVLNDNWIYDEEFIRFVKEELEEKYQLKLTETTAYWELIMQITDDKQEQAKIFNELRDIYQNYIDKNRKSY